MLSQPALSPIQEVPIVEEENESLDDSEFSFLENIHTSKLRVPFTLLVHWPCQS